MGEAIPLRSYRTQRDECRESSSEGTWGLGQIGAFQESCWEENISACLESQQIHRPKVSAPRKDCKEPGRLAATIQLDEFEQCSVFT